MARRRKPVDAQALTQVGRRCGVLLALFCGGDLFAAGCKDRGAVGAADIFEILEATKNEPWPVMAEVLSVGVIRCQC